MTTENNHRWVWSSRLSKQGNVVRELLRVPADELPPGCGFASRHEAKQYGKRGTSARRVESLDDPPRP